MNGLTWRVYRRRLVRSLAGWSLMVVPIAVHRYLTGWLGEAGDWSSAVFEHLEFLLAWALVTPLFVQAAHRLPPTGERRGRNLAVHAGIGLGFALLLNLYGAVFSGGVAGLDRIALVGFERFLFFAPFVLGVYALIVAGVRLSIRESRPDAPPVAASTSPPKPLAIREQYRSHLVPADSVRRIEADGHHVRIYTAERTYRPRTKFSDVLKRLRSAGVIRIHRSHAVQSDFVSEFQTYMHGDAFVILNDGTRLRVSRTYRADVERRLTGGSRSKGRGSRRSGANDA